MWTRLFVGSRFFDCFSRFKVFTHVFLRFSKLWKNSETKNFLKTVKKLWTLNSHWIDRKYGESSVKYWWSPIYIGIAVWYISSCDMCISESFRWYAHKIQALVFPKNIDWRCFSITSVRASLNSLTWVVRKIIFFYSYI